MYWYKAIMYNNSIYVDARSDHGEILRELVNFYGEDVIDRAHDNGTLEFGFCGMDTTDLDYDHPAISIDHKWHSLGSYYEPYSGNYASYPEWSNI